MKSPTNIRPPVLAGRWYPANPDQLARSVDRYLDQAELPDFSGELVAVVSPHAGHQYSGPVAGHAFAILADTAPELVVILSPMHRAAQGSLLTTSHDAYQTPLGAVAVDRSLIKALDETLREKADIQLTQIKQDSEHSIEILLPFLQRSLDKPFRILPIMVLQQDPRLMNILGTALVKHLRGKQAILVASTDLSHFYTAPEAEDLDRTIIKQITELDPEGIFQAEQQGKGYACGKGGLAAVIWAAKGLGANQALHLKYAHSGEITGDLSRVVGYEAAAILRD